MNAPQPSRACLLRLTREIAAAPQRVYEALTAPAELSRWFTTRAEADLRVGGAYSNGDGDRGVFLVLEPPDRLEFTWDNPDHCPGTRVEIRLHRGDGGTLVELIHRSLRSEQDAEEMRGGWSWALDSLRSYLETGRPISHETWLAARQAGGEESSPCDSM